ncbi:MAG: FecR domain-containing protein [Acidobacteria bacterium]|nr:FecR domain-containing protein [Acidobacteriota bacterium]
MRKRLDLQMRWGIWLALPNLWMAAAVIGALPSIAKAQFGAETARIVVLTGRVSVERTGGELWALQPEQIIAAGQVIVTGADGYAELELSDHSRIEVFANSRLIFRANRFNWHDLLDLYLGKIRLQIQHLTNEDSPYRVTTPTAVISIRGTVLDVDVASPEETVVRVETGSVRVRHRLIPGKDVILESGQSLQVFANAPLAAAKFTVPVLAIGRVVRAVVDTLAAMDRPGGQSSGNSGGTSSAGSASSGGNSGSSGANNGSNEPAPPPGEDNTSSPPGDVVTP